MHCKVILINVQPTSALSSSWILRTLTERSVKNITCWLAPSAPVDRGHRSLLCSICKLDLNLEYLFLTFLFLKNFFCPLIGRCSKAPGRRLLKLQSGFRRSNFLTPLLPFQPSSVPKAFSPITLVQPEESDSFLRRACLVYCHITVTLLENMTLTVPDVPVQNRDSHFRPSSPEPPSLCILRRPVPVPRINRRRHMFCPR